MSFGTMVGTLSYGSYSFPANTETLAYSIRPIYDQAGRTVIYNVISITLRAKAFLAAATSANVLEVFMGTLRDTLTKPAQVFIYTDKGMGRLSVNTGAAMKDVVWGPRPQMLNMRHLAADRAVEFEWSVEVATVLCSDAVFENQPLEFNYSVTYDIDRSGYSKRTYAGFVRIPLTRKSANDRTLQTSADEWREKITPQLVTGFRRIYGPFTLSPDRTRLDFSIVDEETGPDYLPEYIVDGTFRHALQSAGEKPGFAMWTGIMDATFEVSRDAPPETAWEKFYEIAKARIKTTIEQRLTKPVENGINTPFVLPIRLLLEEPDIFGKKVSRFQLTYMLVCNFIDILKSSALWTPIDTTWDKWALSMSGSAFKSRGNAKLKYNPADDAIIDLCLSQTIKTPKQPTRAGPDSSPRLRQLASECPDPVNSWFYYESRIVTEWEDGTSMHTPLPTKKLEVVPLTVGIFDTPAGFTLSQYVEQPEAKIQTRMGTANYVWLIGKALRVCYDIPPPELRKIGGVDVTPANRRDRGEGFHTWVFGDYGHEVFAAQWKLRYYLPKPPTQQITGPPTPIYPSNATLRNGNLNNP